MDRLESLDLYGTAVTPACLKVVEHLPKLRHLYVGETKIPADVPVPEALKGKASVLEPEVAAGVGFIRQTTFSQL